MFKIREVSWSGALLATVALCIPTGATAQRSGVEVWSVNCGRCHAIQPALRYSAKSWDDIGMHMIITARLTSAEAQAVVDFLKSGAQRTTSPEEAAPTAPLTPLGARYLVPDALPAQDSVGAAADFARQCAPCHGAKGDGKGTIAAGLNPRPPDFTDPESMKDRSDEDLLTSIAEGKGTMPSFKLVLNEDQIEALVAYIRALEAKR